ncbi:ABC transporter permease [Streptococcus pneumoniae]|nr:ABC transporter permease [Streptococcus pneumoniae]
MRFIDLFSGIGGFRLGMESVGHECIGFCEIDKFARESYKSIFQTEGEIEFHDIRDVSDDEFKKLRGKVDIICGGFPCQAFSIAGRRLGFEDTRGTLFFEIARAAKQIQPRFLFLKAYSITIRDGRSPQSLPHLKSWGILLVSVFVIFVILFYNTLSHFILVSLRKLPQTYYNKLNSFKIRQFSKQADSNSVTLAVLSLTLTLALSLLVFSGSAYTTMNRELNKYSPYDVSVNLYRGQEFQFSQESVKDRLKADGFDFNLIKEEYSYPIYSSDLTYKDLIDTSNLWAHDKELPESKVPILGISAYNHLRKLQGKKAVDLADNQFLVNANYKGTAKQIQDFLLTTKTLMINGYSLNLASSKPLETVYFLSSVGTNDTGTLIVPDTVVVGLMEDHTTYVANFKENIDKRKVETFLSQWIEKYYFTRDGAELNPFTYQTKGRIFEIYLGFMGVIVFVMIFVSVIFIIISLSILSLQTSTSSLDSVNDYQILYLLGNKRKQNRSILLQQILSYFLVPLVIAGPLALALSTALLGYFENFANTSISIDITYLGVAVLLFVLYLLVTYRVSWQIIEN